MKKFFQYTILMALLISMLSYIKFLMTKLIVTQQMSDKHLALYLMMNQWIKIKEDGKELSTYFEQMGYQEIAIYGMSYAGERLFEQLSKSNIKVKYGIDRKSNCNCGNLKIMLPDDKLDNVDAIVVTSIKSFSEIEKMLHQIVTCPILSLEDILYEV